MYRLFITGDLGFEFWKDIPGYEGLYQASTYGRIRSYDWFDALGRRHRGKVLAPNKDKKGYCYVQLGRGKRVAVHRLVAYTFLPENGKPCVDHKDTNRQNNRVENLCFVTYTENSLNPITNARMSKPVVQKTKDGTVVHVFPSMSEAGRCGFTPSSICQCCSGLLKSHRGYIWEFSEG